MTTTITDNALEMDDDPKTHWLPDSRSCPEWCDRSHQQALDEGNSWWVSQEHQGRAHEHRLNEHRNPVDLRVTRPGGGRWDMYPRVRPFGPNGGSRDEPCVLLALSEEGIGGAVTRLYLTSGDARVMARQLLDLADLLDLA